MASAEVPRAAWHRVCPRCCGSLGCVTGVLSPGQAVQGTGLAFIVYTEAIKNMEVSQLWSVLYFFMLLMLGIGSMLGNTAAILTPLTDSKVITRRLPKEAISGERAGERRRDAGGHRAASEATCLLRWPRSCGDLPVVLPSPFPHLGQSGPGCRSPRASGSPRPRNRPDSPAWHQSSPGEERGSSGLCLIEV